jgi:hypothetical protein
VTRPPSRRRTRFCARRFLTHGDWPLWSKQVLVSVEFQHSHRSRASESAYPGLDLRTRTPSWSKPSRPIREARERIDDVRHDPGQWPIGLCFNGHQAPLGMSLSETSVPISEAGGARVLPCPSRNSRQATASTFRARHARPGCRDRDQSRSGAALLIRVAGDHDHRSECHV